MQNACLELQVLEQMGWDGGFLNASVGDKVIPTSSACMPALSWNVSPTVTKSQKGKDYFLESNGVFYQTICFSNCIQIFSNYILFLKPYSRSSFLIQKTINLSAGLSIISWRNYLCLLFPKFTILLKFALQMVSCSTPGAILVDCQFKLTAKMTMCPCSRGEIL